MARDSPSRRCCAHVAPLAQAISDTLRSGVPVARRKLRLDGRPSYLGVSVSPLAGPDRELQAAVCLFTDLTEVVELEEQLRLKEALAGVGELTAGLAHEFRNGLATIHGYARLVDLTKLPEAYRPYVEGIRHGNQRDGRGGHQLSQLRPARAARARAARPASDRRTSRGGLCRSNAAASTWTASSGRSSETKCSCARR